MKLFLKKYMEAGSLLLKKLLTLYSKYYILNFVAREELSPDSSVGRAGD